MKRILVIGSNSFSGSWCIREALDRGHRVWGISRRKEIEEVFLPYKWSSNKGDFEFCQIDINNDISSLKGLICNIRPQVVISFAGQGMVAQSWQWPEDWYQTNVVALAKVVECLRNEDSLESFIHASTPEVYGNSKYGRVKENRVYAPTTPYAVSKAAFDMHLDCQYRSNAFPAVITRSANVYGEGQQLYRIIPRALWYGLNKKRLMLDGGGFSRRNFIHISDVAKATVDIVENPRPGTVWHIAGDNLVSIRKLVETCAMSMGMLLEELADDCDERKGKDNCYDMDSAALKIEYGWKASVDLDHGIARTLEWLKKNRDIVSQHDGDYIHEK